MKSKNLEYLESYLKNVKIIKDKKSGNEIILRYFKTHYSNGRIFQHKDGNNYGIAIFNALTDFSEKKIIKYFKENPDLTLSEYTEYIDDLLLSKYVYSNSVEYETWNNGDLGVLFLKWDNEKRKFVTENFINATAITNNNKIREKIEYRNFEENDYGNSNYETLNSNENFNSEFYNDQLDMDQQNPEFWDNL